MTDTQATLPETLTAGELAALLKVTPDTLRRKRLRGEIPKPFLDTTRPRWSREQIDIWLAGNQPQR